ncbi:MAG: PIG-L family deacetylase [Zavarzinella sp.]
MSKTALAILAHPDDAEFLCAGTLIRLQQEHGWKVHIATMTAGDCGSTEHSPEEIAAIRRQEGANAAALMGAEYTCLEVRDLRVIYSEALMEKVVQFMVSVRPSLVITHSPDDYHMDHEMTSRTVRGATFAAPIPNYLFDRWSHAPLEHIPHLYYCDPLEGKDVFGQPIVPQFRLNITEQIPLKEKMLAAHASQREWLIRHHGVDDYIIAMKHWAETQGKALGVPFAEGFRQHLGHSYPQNNLLVELLG